MLRFNYCVKFFFLIVKGLRDIFPKTITWVQFSCRGRHESWVYFDDIRNSWGHRSHRRELVDGPDDNFKVVGLKTEISKCITVRRCVEVHVVIKNIKSCVCKVENLYIENRYLYGSRRKEWGIIIEGKYSYLYIFA